MLRIRDRLEKIFSRVDVDCIVVMNKSPPVPSFFYITGLCGGLFEGCFAVAFRDRCVLLSAGLDYVKSDEIEVVDFKNSNDLKKKLQELTRLCKKVGFDGMATSYHDYQKLRKLLRGKKLVDIGTEMVKCRFNKDDYEIEMIRRACKVADRVFDKIIDDLKEGIKEKEMAIMIETLIKEYGGDDKAFDSIVAFGKNSAIPHHVPGNRRLRRGDIILLDFGARYRGYVSDITRSFVYGRADDRIREVFDVVLRAQQIGKDTIKEGVKLEEPHDRVARYINGTRFRGKFIHSLGHTIGLEVHDGYRLGKGCKEIFSNGVTFTIEPGVYLKSVGGIRIEDDFVFMNGRVKRLSRAPVFLETIF